MGIPSDATIEHLTDSVEEIVARSTTPYERRNIDKETPYQFSSEEGDVFRSIRDNTSGGQRLKAFDMLAKKEMSGQENWQKSKEILNWYLNRDTWEECGSVGSLELQHQIVNAHARYLLKEAPVLEKLTAMIDVISANWDESRKLLTKP